MGAMLRAVCECGYNKPFSQGGGMRDFETMDREPAYCTYCKDLVVVNFLAKRHKCTRCGRKVTFYNDPSLCSEEDVKYDRWGNFLLPASCCLCPKCGRKTLEFVCEGCFD